MTRKLAAIVAADVVGYSRLMGADEAGTLAALKTHRRELVDPRIAAHHGRIVKTTGDGLLVEFPSVVEAVQCAVEVQQTMRERNAAVPEERRIEFRVGINLGDVIIDGDDIHGDGVNVAARLEALADAGGVCVSRVVHEQVRDKLDLVFDDLGEQQVKNIVRPIHVFRVVSSAIGHSAAPARPALALPDKPSIAVLAFQNMSGDPEQEYFADGMVDDIITALSHFPRLFVIARNSSFTYKGRAGIDIRQVGRELGVRYVLEGSVRRAGDRVRITGQLIDATSGTHLWAERFDGVLADIFDLQDNIARSVVGAIEPRLMSAEVERAQRKRTTSLDAYDLYLQALPHFHAMTREDNNIALRLLAQALAIDPDYAVAAGFASWCYVQRVLYWQVDQEAEKHAGIALGHRAVAKGPNDPDALASGGCAIVALGGAAPPGLAAVERAIVLNPNGALVLTYAGLVYLYIGEPAKAVPMCERAMRQSPRDPAIFRTYMVLSVAGMSRAVLKFARQASLFEQATRPWLAVQDRG